MLWYSGQACQFSGLQPQCSPACSRERAAEHTARALLPAQPGRSQQQQQQMMATERASPKGVFHAREARKPYFRLLHMLGLHLLCLSTPFFSPFLFLVLTLVHSTTSLFNYVFAESFSAILAESSREYYCRKYSV